MGAQDFLTGHVLIERPILDVFRYALDFKSLPLWMPYCQDVRSIDWPREEMPKSLEARLWFGPLPFWTKVEIFDVLPGRKLSCRTKFPPQFATYQFEPTDGGTLVLARHDPWTWAMLGPMSEIIRPMVGDVLNQALVAFKRRVEGTLPPASCPVFLSYHRKSKDDYLPGRLQHSLSQEFGHGAIFQDLHSLVPGDAWEIQIEEQLRSSFVVVALIDERWIERIKEKEKKESSWVLKEITAALDSNKEIIPVLVGKSASLDQSFSNELRKLGLGKLISFNWQVLRPDPDYTSDIEKIIQGAWAAMTDRIFVDGDLPKN